MANGTLGSITVLSYVRLGYCDLGTLNRKYGRHATLSDHIGQFRRVFVGVRFAQPHTPSAALVLAHPAIINPDSKKSEQTGTEITRPSVEKIHSRFDNAKTQDVWIFLPDERSDVVEHGVR